MQGLERTLWNDEVGHVACEAVGSCFLAVSTSRVYALLSDHLRPLIWGLEVLSSLQFILCALSQWPASETEDTGASQDPKLCQQAPQADMALRSPNTGPRIVHMPFSSEDSWQSP